MWGVDIVVKFELKSVGGCCSECGRFVAWGLGGCGRTEQDSMLRRVEMRSWPPCTPSKSTRPL